MRPGERTPTFGGLARCLWDASNAHEVRPAATSPCMAASSDRVVWRTAGTIAILITHVESPTRQNHHSVRTQTIRPLNHERRIRRFSNLASPGPLSRSVKSWRSTNRGLKRPVLDSAARRYGRVALLQGTGRRRLVQVVVLGMAFLLAWLSVLTRPSRSRPGTRSICLLSSPGRQGRVCSCPTAVTSISGRTPSVGSRAGDPDLHAVRVTSSRSGRRAERRFPRPYHGAVKLLQLTVRADTSGQIAKDRSSAVGGRCPSGLPAPMICS